MIKVTVSDNDRLLDVLEFDAVNVLHHGAGVAVVHRDSCGSAGERRNLVPRRPRSRHRSRARRPAGVAARERRRTQPNGGPAAGADETDEDYLGRLPEHANARPIVDDDLYKLERDPDENDEHYRERCRMLGCGENGFIRLPRSRQ
jgi:hypothetical protein